MKSCFDSFSRSDAIACLRCFSAARKTLHNWEQGRGKPTGAARVLLRVASRHPEVVLEEAMA